LNKFSFAAATAEEKATLLGPEFRNIAVLGFSVAGGVTVTTIVIVGKTFQLIGNPRDALRALPHLGMA
jgi:hypothetical protein